MRKSSYEENLPSPLIQQLEALTVTSGLHRKIEKVVSAIQNVRSWAGAQKILTPQNSLGNRPTVVVAFLCVVEKEYIQRTPSDEWLRLTIEFVSTDTKLRSSGSRYIMWTICFDEWGVVQQLKLLKSAENSAFCVEGEAVKTFLARHRKPA